MTMRVIRARSVTYYPRAECTECEWGAPSEQIARDLAKSHTQNTGHRTLAIAEARDTYERRET